MYEIGLHFYFEYLKLLEERKLQRNTNVIIDTNTEEGTDEESNKGVIGSP